jgi:hypothetical protein
LEIAWAGLTRLVGSNPTLSAISLKVEHRPKKGGPTGIAFLFGFRAQLLGLSQKLGRATDTKEARPLRRRTPCSAALLAALGDEYSRTYHRLGQEMQEP